MPWCRGCGDEVGDVTRQGFCDFCEADEADPDYYDLQEDDVNDEGQGF